MDNEEYGLNYDEENDFEDYCDEGISFIRDIICPYCNHAHTIDLSDYVYDVQSDERQMGDEITHSFESDEFECDKCKKKFKFNGYICEYPTGSLNDEDITFEGLEDEDKEEEDIEEEDTEEQVITGETFTCPDCGRTFKAEEVNALTGFCEECSRNH